MKALFVLASTLTSHIFLMKIEQSRKWQEFPYRTRQVGILCRKLNWKLWADWQWKRYVSASSKKTDEPCVFLRKVTINRSKAIMNVYKMLILIKMNWNWLIIEHVHVLYTSGWLKITLATCQTFKSTMSTEESRLFEKIKPHEIKRAAFGS